MILVAHTARRLAVGWCAVILALTFSVGVGGAETKAEHAAPQAESAKAETPGGGHGAAHAGHDPYDLTHANATAQMEDPSEWRYDMTLCTFAVFVVLLALLTKFAWTPIMKGLENREKFIADKIEEARRSAEQAADELQAYRTKIAAANQEAATIVTKARKDAEAVAEKIRNESKQAADRERERAVAEIHAAKNAALREVARRSADLAVTLAGRIVHRELSSSDHAVLIKEALEQLPSKN